MNTTAENYSAHRYMTKKEFAALLGISPGTLDNWVKQGHVRVLKIGRIVRFPSDATAALENHRDDKSKN